MFGVHSQDTGIHPEDTAKAESAKKEQELGTHIPLCQADMIGLSNAKRGEGVGGGGGA